jgi:glutamate--cysteine ligase
MWEVYQQVEQDEHSLQTFITEQYFGLLRNLQRVGWLIPYLFGASPAVCKSFLGGKSSNLEEYDQNTFYGSYATSLRMGDIGYQNNKENEIGVKACYDNLDEYIETISYAIETSYPGYEKIGVKVDGKYRQLNANILQIENEYYSTVRPKQPLNGNEKPIRALMERGVKYVELRSLDINPFAAAGVDIEQLRFLEMLFIYALFEHSPPIAPWERGEIDKNEMNVAHYGRKPQLTLMRNGDKILLKSWASEVLDKIEKIACMLDKIQGNDDYQHSLQIQREAVNDPDKTLSGRVLKGMQQSGKSFFDFTWGQSLESFQDNQKRDIETDNERHLLDISYQSVIAQHHIEQNDKLSFDEYLEAYLKQ